MNYGYTGSILTINLSNGTTKIGSTYEYSDRFLGGRGIATSIYWNETSPHIDAFDESNNLIFALGPLAGIPALGGSRWGIFGKSPLLSPNKFCYGNLGGSFGAELKFAGYDGLIITGKSDKKGIIIINDDEIEIVDAAEYWGEDTITTRSRLKDKYGKKAKVVAIGPAGENKVPSAIMLADGDASGSGGLGAVMGSKNLKAIVVMGTRRKTDVADYEALSDLAKKVKSYGRGNTKVWGVDFMAHGPKTKKSPCYGCMANCLRVDYKADDGKNGKFMCQSRFFYFVHALVHYQKDTDVPFHANKLCDMYGIDTWHLQDTMDWLNRCFQAGIITEQETGIPLSKIGSIDYIEKLVDLISNRIGFGDIIADGAENAAEKIGKDAVGQLKHIDAYEPRLYTINALLFPFETRIPIQQIHEAGLTLAQWATWAKGDKSAHISGETVKGIARKFWGGEEAADQTTYEGKAVAARKIQDRQYAKESLILCDWMYPLIDNPSGEDHVGDPTIESRILSAVLGKEFDEESLSKIGERIFNLQRAILLREGHQAVDDDYLPSEWHDKPLESHVADPELLAPGKNGEKQSRKGNRIKRDDYRSLLNEYYHLRGWDQESGLQKRETLSSMGMADVADTLEKLHLIT